MIDVHAHVAPRAYDAFATRHGLMLPSIKNVPMDDGPAALDSRHEMMLRAGIRTQVLSPPAMPWCDASEQTAVQATCLFNEAAAELSQKWRGTLAAYVSLPLPHIQASLEELERGLDHLRLAGVTLPCSVRGCSIAHDEFFPIFEACHRRGAVIFLHPCVNGVCSALVNDYRLAPSVGTLFEDTLALVHLIVKRIPYRLPGVKIVVPHLGGLTPMLLERLDNQLPWAYPDLPERPSDTARRFWYDTVAHGSAASFRCALESLGGERIVPGSDFPFLLPHMSYADIFNRLWTTSGVSAAGLLASNATRLFGEALP